MEIALILIAFVLNNIAWMYMLYIFTPKRKVDKVDISKFKIKNMLAAPIKKGDVRIPLINMDPTEILDSYKKTRSN